MKRISVLCEDKQHAAFIRRFLKKRKRSSYVIPGHQPGKGSGEQFVRENYPKQLNAARKRNGNLVVVIDGNTVGALERMRQLDKVCDDKNIKRRKPADPAVVFIPTRSIETWFTYLEGEVVDETQQYPRLKEERDCQRHVDVLIQMCNANKLRHPAPPSLQTACEEYARLR